MIVSRNHETICVNQKTHEEVKKLRESEFEPLGNVIKRLIEEYKK